MKSEKEVRKTLEKIRRAEAELTFATPAHAARLASKIARWKSTAFDP